MERTRTSYGMPLWTAIIVALAAATIWAGMAFGAGSGSSGSSSTPTPPSYSGSGDPFAVMSSTADDHSSADCPNMGGESGDDQGTAPNGGGSATPSTSDGSDEPTL